MDKKSHGTEPQERYNSVSILDCTLRDGGYVNDWRFELDMARDVYRSLAKSGIDFVELGFVTSPEFFDSTKHGPFRACQESKLQYITQGIQGPPVALMCDHGKLKIADLPDKQNSVASMIRLAVHRDKINQAIKFLELVKNKNYLTSLQVMGYANYNEPEKANLLAAASGSGLDYLYIADSYGSMVPEDITPIFEPFLALDGLKVGFHPHNSLQLAFANTLEAIKIGVNIVDGSIYGMGRGSGNLPTEVLLSFLSRFSSKYNVIPLLNCIDRYFISLKRQTPWGYQLSYMISGIFKCHPYFAAEIVQRKEYTMEGMWKGLEVIQEINPVGYDGELIKKLIELGVLGSLGKKALHIAAKVGSDTPDASRPKAPYINRHEGSDILILANGPTLKEYQPKIQKFIAKYQPVIMGANYLAGLFEPHYHAFVNLKRFTMYVGEASPRSKLLLGENIPESLISEYTQRPYERLYFRDILNADFDIVDGRIQTNCRTVSVLLCGVAIVMGAHRIFVAGMDGYMGKTNIRDTLFYEEAFEPEENKVNKERHMWNDRFLREVDQYFQDKGKEGIHILTPTSHQHFYKGIDNYV